MRSGLGSLVVIIAGCGRLNFEIAPGVDAPGSSDDAAPFDDRGTFSTPVEVLELQTLLNEEDPTFSVDQLELFFTRKISDASPEAEIMTATRSDRGLAWSAPTVVPGINTAAWEGTPTLTRDGLTLYLASRIQGTFDLYEATRSARGAAWSAPRELTSLSSAAAESALITTDGLTGWFVSDRTGTSEIYVTTHATRTDPWSAPTLREDLNSPSHEYHPWLSPDGLVIYFASDRLGGLGLRDLWRATRATTDDPFGPATPVTELNSSELDSDPWLSDDGRTILFMSLRNGDYDIFMATR